MKRTVVVVFWVLAILAVAAIPAHATVITLNGTGMIDGRSYSMPINVNVDSKGIFTATQSAYSVTSPSGNTLTLQNIHGDMDFVLTFNASCTNSTAGSIVCGAAIAGVPIVPGIGAGAPVSLAASLSGSYSSLDAGSMTPVAATIAQMDINGTVVTGVGPGQAFPGFLGSQSYTPALVFAGSVCPAGGCLTASTAIVWNQTGGPTLSSSGSFTSLFVINAVPEPSSLLLLGSGLIGIGLAIAGRRGRRRV